MAIKKNELYSSLWASCDKLRGGMDASQYKDYILTLLFVKYVTDKFKGVKYADITVPEGGSFDDLVALKGNKNIGEEMDKVIAKLAEAGENNLRGVIDNAHFNDEAKLGSGKEMVDKLTGLIAIFQRDEFNFKKNKGLAKGFMAGLDACLRNGADIIVNTDADNQYCGEDIEKIVRPILNGEADIVIGERPIDQTEHFSPLKKKLQHFGSWVVRKASNSDIPDAPSGFRAYSRDAAMRLNVTNEYTYTLETIVQAGRTKMAMTSVPIRTNAELRPSRLFSSMFGYVKRSMLTIIRAFLMYKPLSFFMGLGTIPVIGGVALGIRFIVYAVGGSGAGHIQSLILASMLIIIGVLVWVLGLMGDIIASNRKLLEDIQYHVRKLDYDSEKEEN